MDDPRNRLLSWCEVDAAALRHNLDAFRARIAPGAKLLLVVKANAYGHGLPEIAGLARSVEVDALGVHQLDEAATTRGAGWPGPLWVLGYTPHAQLAEGVELGVEFTVYDLATLEALDRLGRSRERPVACHLKLETGTNRQGILAEDLDRYLGIFSSSPGIRLAGVSTHFANIEDTTDHAFALAQWGRFRALLERVRAAGFTEAVPHAACSAAVLVMPETSVGCARVGIGAYGIWPSRETLASHANRGESLLQLLPALTWKARIAQVKQVPAGAFIGYGCTRRTGRPSRIAVLPVGYFEGYDRRFSNLAHILVQGYRAPVLGRVCMDMFMADVTDVPGVEREDEAVLIGRQGDEEIRAADLAAIAQTIPYEILSRLSPHLPRIVVNSEPAVAAPS
jgi:alanine racemase